MQNFTDIDDKIIDQANKKGKPHNEIADNFIDEFFTDINGLNILKANHYPRVTQEIDDIIKLISTLIDSGNAYEIQGTVYFAVNTANDYGKLSNKIIKDLQIGARVKQNDQKQNPNDFVLWKPAKQDEPAWQSPWGMGRPGWHIECSVMSRKFIGHTIDIHCGGQDLIFPHHENEIAQSEASSHKPFVKYWLHNGMITFNQQKMSKSEGNFFLVRDIAKSYPYEAIRLFLLSVHYRSPLSYSTESMEAANASLARLTNCKALLTEALEKPESGDQNPPLSNFKASFMQALNDDLNTANAISTLFELVRMINSTLPNASNEFINQAIKEFDFCADLLGLKLDRPQSEGDQATNQDIEELIEKRAQAKKDKNWQLADEIRSQLKSMGITIEDTKEGITRWYNER